MDIAVLAQNATAALTPFLPYLLKLGDKAVEEAGKKLGGNAWDQAKLVWSKLSPSVEASPNAKEAASDVVAAPDDMDVQAVLRVQIKKLLTQNQELAREIAQSLDEGRQPSVTVVVSGERAFGNAGDISGSTIITGDHPKT
jgi:predicted XRE-type DNA-binding protein